MKKRFLYIIAALVLIGYSCTDKWDQHYTPEEKVVKSGFVEVSNLSAEAYIQSNADLTSISSLLTEQNVFSKLEAKDQLFTVLVYENSEMSNAQIEDPEFFANTCVSDLAFTPTKLVNGLSVQMWNGKYLEVNVEKTASTTDYYIAGSKISKIVQVNDGFVYVMSAPIYAPKSLYEVLSSLGADYSRFKELVFAYEEQAFDRANSVPVGVDNTGNTVYDSVFVTKNLLMDRYSSGGSESWNMRSEFYSSTLLIPNNTLVDQALTKAYQDVRDALNRETNANDTLKFEQYIIKSAFYDQVLTQDMLDGTDDIYSVSGYIEGETASTPGVQWKPTVQRVNTTNQIKLSNGVAYYTTQLKIPNNVVIWRIKNRFYNWDYCNETEKQEYFVWDGLTNPRISGTGYMGPIGIWPRIYYKTVQADPTDEAKANSSPVSVECTGIALEEDGTISVVKVPPGEYDLRMGFEANKYPWKADIYFNGELVKENVDPNGGHYDRYGGDYFAEGYNYKDWLSYDAKARNYDKDGMDIGVVTITGDELQPIKIKIVSNNIAEIRASGNSRGKMVIYHWSLRPTSNNY